MNVVPKHLADNRFLICDTLLRAIAADLDIPLGKYREAVQRYTSVGDWLESGNYPGMAGNPAIYVQGSFRLGTVIRPFLGGRDADYDIDLACELNASLYLASASTIKQMVGNRLKEHGTYREMLDPEGRRCWTLIYAEHDGIGFHLDVLPCVPHPITSPAIEPRYGNHAIGITNRDSPGGPCSWGLSNPDGFAEWFADRQRPAFARVAMRQKQELFRQHPNVFVSVADVPDQFVRTPLQIAVQLLKRHRDVRFSGRSDEVDKPISIIITTLAARAYQQEVDVFTTLANFLDKVERYQDTRLIECVDGRWTIENPTSPGENFADRWNEEESQKADRFFEWLDWVREDLDELLNTSSRDQLEQLLTDCFGETPGRRVAANYLGALPGAYQRPASVFRRVTGPLLRFDVEHRESPSWRVRPTQHAASIRARYRRHGFRPTAFQNNSPPLRKGLDLDFDVSTTVPKPFTVYWQVVNTGDEAYRAGQLRGDFYDSSKSGRSRTESTKYRGMHWVEAFVIKDGVCVARTGEFVVNVE